MKFAVYATFEQMHGRKSSVAELVDRLRPFSRESVLYTCAATGMILKLWEGTDWDYTNYDLFINTSFDQLRGDWYKLSARTGDIELVVHRRQLLLIMKLSLEHCSASGSDLLTAPPGYFGTILLMANDQFHYGLYPFPEQGSADEREKVSRVLAEFVPVNEYAGSRIEHRIVRSHLMLTKYTDQLASHPDFVNVASVYTRCTGISLREHEALTFGLFSRCNMVTVSGLQQNPWSAAIKAENFHTTAIPQDTIHRFFSEFAATPRELKQEVENARRKGQDHGTNDFTVFRKRPLVSEAYGMLPTDFGLIMEKFATGPYWRVNDTDRETGDKLRRFWGAVFEAYVNEYIELSAQRSGAIFVPDPQWLTDPFGQVCDGILIEGDALVLMEYKSNMFTARAKYGGNHVLLHDEIVTKLVRNEEEGKKKGVEQLANAVVRLIRNQRDVPINGINMSHISRIYPLLLTLDDLGSTLLMSRLLNEYFNEFVGAQTFSAQKIRPLLCTDIESLELVLRFLDICPLSDFLQNWLNEDRKLMATLVAHLPKGLPKRRDQILYTEWERLSEQIESLLFPAEHQARKNV